MATPWKFWRYRDFISCIVPLTVVLADEVVAKRLLHAASIDTFTIVHSSNCFQKLHFDVHLNLFIEPIYEQVPIPLVAWRQAVEIEHSSIIGEWTTCSEIIVFTCITFVFNHHPQRCRHYLMPGTQYAKPTGRCDGQCCEVLLIEAMMRPKYLDVMFNRYINFVYLFDLTSTGGSCMSDYVTMVE